MGFGNLQKLSLTQFIESEIAPGALWIFVHIPRTAGSSFADELTALQPSHKRLRVDSTDEQLPYAKKMNKAVDQFARELETRAYKACSGHIKMTHVRRIRSIEPTARVITLIRNPVDRVISDFRYCRTPAHPSHREFIQKYRTIHDYVDAPESQDKMFRFLAPPSGADVTELLAEIDRSITFIGLLEMYPMSFNIISRLLGQNRFPKIHNRAVIRTAENEVSVDAALKRRIIKNNEWDAELYDHVRRSLIGKRLEWKDMLLAEKRLGPETARQQLLSEDVIPSAVRRTADTSEDAKQPSDLSALRERAESDPAQQAKRHPERQVERLDRARLAGLVHRVRWLEQERTRMRAENARLSGISREVFEPQKTGGPHTGNSYLERVSARRARSMELLQPGGAEAEDFAVYAKEVHNDPRRLAAYLQNLAVQQSPEVSRTDKAFARAICDLFDSAYYRSANCLADGEATNPLLHYAVTGRSGNLKTNPLFDSEYYISQIGESDKNAFLHFAEVEASLGCKPNPLFDPRFYATQCGSAGTKAGDLLCHYQTTGALLRLDPSSVFDTAYYLSAFEHPDDVEVPLEYYVLAGDRPGPDPHPLFSAEHLRSTPSERFPEAAMLYYLKNRAVQFERDPHPLFSLHHLRQSNCVSPDDPRSPIEQYLAACKDKDVDSHPAFDSAFYRYQLEHERGMTLTIPPILHYLTIGFRDKSLRPHPLFDPNVYLTANGLQHDGPELLRYLSGKDGNGLRCHQLFDSRYYDSRRGVPADATAVRALEHWVCNPDRKLPTDSRLLTPLDPVPFDLIGRAVSVKEEFDPDFYRKLYNEFAAYDEFAARDHYENHGKGEGRHGSARSLLANLGIGVADVPIGFFPTEYVALHPDLEIWRDQPMRCLVHYLEHGRAEGRQIGYWRLKVDNLELEIPTPESPLRAPATSQGSRTCILVHIYYPELWPELAAFVRNLQVAPADVFINVTDSQWTPKLHRELRALCPDGLVQLSPNRGRDIGGHLRLLDNVDIGRYDTFALMHTKKSRHLPEATATGWRQGLIAPFAGNPAVASECLNLFSEQPKTGIVGAAAWRAHSMNGNQIEVDRLMRRFGIEPRHRRLDFVSGTMFLVRAEIVARLHRELRESAWEDATGKDPAFFMDGQLEHAVERVIPSLARQMGYEIVWR